MAVDENGDGVIVFAEFLVAMQTLAEQFELHNEGGDAQVAAGFSVEGSQTGLKQTTRSVLPLERKLIPEALSTTSETLW